LNWYDRVSKDISSIPEAAIYYESELQSAKIDSRISGNLEKAAANMPGIVENRFNQLQEIEAILEYLNIELRRLKSQHFRRYLENYQRSLSSRDCEKFVDGEVDVVDFEKIINEFALLRNKWLGIIKALDIKQWQISNIVKLRTAGLEDATL
jgi:superfamily I DNA/RNA helicase